MNLQLGKRRQRPFMLSLLLLTLIVLVSCGGEGSVEEEAGLRSIRLPMGYIPDPQYAPFYVAQEKGYYAEAGLDVEFDYSNETDGMALVAAGELPFAIVSGEQVILARAQEAPVVYVLEWFQQFPIVLISDVESGVTEPADLAGRTVGLPGLFGASYVGYAGLLSANGLSLEDVNTLEIGFNQVEALRTEQAEAVVGYANNEPLQLADIGEAVNVIYVSEYVDMVANGIVTNEDVIAEEPELVHGFVRATLRGLADTLAAPDEAYEISKGYVEELGDERRDVLQASLPMWEAETLGRTDAASWAQTEEVLQQIDFLDAPLGDLDAAYTNEFIEANQPAR